MKLSDLLASIGVIILLIGFLLNLFNKIKAEDRLYAWLNFLARLSVATPHSLSGFILLLF